MRIVNEDMRNLTEISSEKFKSKSHQPYRSEKV